jgi:hypothetical protein
MRPITRHVRSLTGRKRLPTALAPRSGGAVDVTASWAGDIWIARLRHVRDGRGWRWHNGHHKRNWLDRRMGWHCDVCSSLNGRLHRRDLIATRLMEAR